VAERPILLEAEPPSIAEPRYGWGGKPNAALEATISRRAPRYLEVLDTIASHAEALRRIPVTGGGMEVHWGQNYWTGLDAAALYAFVVERRPARYHEIGSGNSTLFAHRAAADAGVTMRIVSVDPDPRAGIDGLCAETVRSRLQDAGRGQVAALARLEAGDILVVDGSHYALMNSDVTVFFLEVLPELPPGVLVGVHDVFLPDDYPWWLRERWYNEQYLLAAWLLGSGGAVRIELAAHFVATRPELRGRLDAMWSRCHLPGLAYGSALWFET
jgi:hypothetical protein